jgi:hypothetical protein
MLLAFLTGCVGRFATEEALDEIYRVLKEGAVFGMIWNIDDCEIVLTPRGLTKACLILNKGTDSWDRQQAQVLGGIDGVGTAPQRLGSQPRGAR